MQPYLPLPISMWSCLCNASQACCAANTLPFILSCLASLPVYAHPCLSVISSLSSITTAASYYHYHPLSPPTPWHLLTLMSTCQCLHFSLFSSLYTLKSLGSWPHSSFPLSPFWGIHFELDMQAIILHYITTLPNVAAAQMLPPQTSLLFECCYPLKCCLCPWTLQPPSNIAAPLNVATTQTLPPQTSPPLKCHPTQTLPSTLHVEYLSVFPRLW